MSVRGSNGSRPGRVDEVKKTILNDGGSESFEPCSVDLLNVQLEKEQCGKTSLYVV